MARMMRSTSRCTAWVSAGVPAAGAFAGGFADGPRAVDEARPYRPFFPLGAPDRD